MRNPALNLAPFSRWTLCDKATQRRLALCWALRHNVIYHQKKNLNETVYISGANHHFLLDCTSPCS